MTSLRLFAATCILATIILAALASASSLSRAKNENEVAPERDLASIDATADATADAIADAIAFHAAHYEKLKEDYTKEGCRESWGEYPTSTSKSSIDVASMDLKGKKVCSCGMMYDLAVSSLEVLQEANEEGNEDYDSEAGVQTNSIFIHAPPKEKRTRTAGGKRTTKPTALESSIMARTSNSKSKCSEGSADGWPCDNVDLIAHLPLNSFETTDTSEPPRSGNDLWGWTHESESGNREFVIWGVWEGHYFFEVTGFDPILLGYLPPTNGKGALQGDVKVLNDYAYMGSEANDHGMQIFDLKRLLTIDPEKDCVSSKYCQELTPDQLYEGNSTFEVGNSHNIVVNEDNPNHVYIVGTNWLQACKGGLHVVDVSDPQNPTTAGCFAEDGYVHDAHCVNYNGPDTNFKNSEICFCFNENSVAIVDVTDKSNMSLISKISYGKTEYTHQGWLSSDHTHVVFGDELDEWAGRVDKTRTLVVNVENLQNPGDPLSYFGSTKAIDHNQYIIKATAKGQDYNLVKYRDTDLIYQANYRAGLEILQVIDYETADFVKVGLFDTYPNNDNSGFSAAWSVYPYFPSGLVAISTSYEGLFLVEPKLGSSLVAPSEKDCSDDPTFRYENDEKKDCEWVGKAKSEKKLRKRCRFEWEDSSIKNYCRETCGKAGYGPCKAEFSR